MAEIDNPVTPPPTEPQPVTPPAPEVPAPKPHKSSYGIILSIVGLVLFLGPALLLANAIRTPGPLSGNKVIVVPKNMPLADISFLLGDNGIIEHPLVFRIAAHLLAGGNIRAGEYQFTPNENLSSVIAQMREGQVVIHRFVLTEGMTSAEVIELLEADPVLTGTISTEPVEGALFPATYNYTYGDSRVSLVDLMQKKQKELLTDLWDKRDKAIPLASPQEVVVLASIVEKETGRKAEERARVAGVFYNRLKIGMRLQSDPTVIYALTQGKEPLARPLVHADLDTASPYNTYVNAGLPPKPICNPGKAAIKAVLHPETNAFLYFVADGTGGHAFARDLTQHNRNVTQWNKIKQQPAQ